MSGRPSAKMIAAMRRVLGGMTPYAAAKAEGIALATMYKSSIYKLWRAGEMGELEAALSPPSARLVGPLGQ